jgi:hypothetical protein
VRYSRAAWLKRMDLVEAHEFQLFSDVSTTIYTAMYHIQLLTKILRSMAHEVEKGLKTPNKVISFIYSGKNFEAK